MQSWTCVGSNGGVCPAPASGLGDINEQVDLPVGGVVTFSARVRVDLSTPDGVVISNTANIGPAPGMTDTCFCNNTDTDDDSIINNGRDSVFNRQIKVTSTPVTRPSRVPSGWKARP